MRRRSRRPPCCSTCSRSWFRPETARGGSRPAWSRVSPCCRNTRASSSASACCSGSSSCPRSGAGCCRSGPISEASIALLMFLPVVLWNADHDWISFRLQFGRVGSGGFTLRYLGEFLAGQIGLASPFIAILGVAGLVSIARSRDSKRALDRPRLMVPALAFFLWQSLRGRVQGNWPSFLYPAFAVAAVAACLSPALQQWRALRWSARAGDAGCACHDGAHLCASGLWDRARRPRTDLAHAGRRASDG